MKICVAGENSLIIYFGDKINPDISAQVEQACERLRASCADLIIDLVPSYASLLVIYNLYKIDYENMHQRVRTELEQLPKTRPASAGNLVTLPIWYSAESGPDLEMLADRAELSIQKVIEIHQSREYRVYAIGFAPGFAYMGDVDERIAAPRHATPRAHVDRGTLGIADRQTAIYPAPTPGGWNLIGRCPLRMFDPRTPPHVRVKVGDRVRFEAISRERYVELGGEL